MRSSKPKPAAAEHRLERALAEAASALGATGVPWMVIGGIATIARGVRRMTTDIDVLVRGNETKPAARLRALATMQIVPRINDAEAFARKWLALLLRHKPTGVDLDLSFGWTTFEHEALEARSDAAYGSVVAPMARAEDLVIFKAMAARPTDIEDATALILDGDDQAERTITAYTEGQAPEHQGHGPVGPIGLAQSGAYRPSAYCGTAALNRRVAGPNGTL